MKSYIYHGPLQHLSIAIGRKKDKGGDVVSVFKDVAFVPGEQIDDLPEDNPVVQSLVTQKLLTPVAAKPARNPKPKEKSNA